MSYVVRYLEAKLEYLVLVETAEKKLVWAALATIADGRGVSVKHYDTEEEAEFVAFNLAAKDRELLGKVSVETCSVRGCPCNGGWR